MTDLSSTPEKAPITSITGQDGSYLAELSLSKESEFHGLIRRSSSLSTGRIDHLYRDELCGAPSKAAQKLGWRPQTYFVDPVRMMVEADLRDAGLDPGRYLKQTTLEHGS